MSVKLRFYEKCLHSWISRTPLFWEGNFGYNLRVLYARLYGKTYNYAKEYKAADNLLMLSKCKLIYSIWFLENVF